MKSSALTVVGGHKVSLHNGKILHHAVLASPLAVKARVTLISFAILVKPNLPTNSRTLNLINGLNGCIMSSSKTHKVQFPRKNRSKKR